MSIELTMPAAEEIRRIIAAQGLDLAATHLHVGVEGEGPQRRYILDLTDREQPDHETFISRGLGITCQPAHLKQLDGATIDFREQESLGWGFVFDLPTSKQVTRGRGDAGQPMPTEDEVHQTLRQVIDPEVGVNIIDLGLVYGVTILGRIVRVRMTMTTPACPMSDMIRRDVDQRLRGDWRGVDTVEVELVWEPRWNSDMISPAGKAQLGWSR